jgi:hypothetical protein
MKNKRFFNGPFNPKYKDLNLFNKEENTLQIKEFIELKKERYIDRCKQVKLIEKFKKMNKPKLKFINN